MTWIRASAVLVAAALAPTVSGCGSSAPPARPDSAAAAAPPAAETASADGGSFIADVPGPVAGVWAVGDGPPGPGAAAVARLLARARRARPPCGVRPRPRHGALSLARRAGPGGLWRRRTQPLRARPPPRRPGLCRPHALRRAAHYAAPRQRHARVRLQLGKDARFHAAGLPPLSTLFHAHA